TDLAAMYEQECDAVRKEIDFPLGLQDAFALAHYEWLDAVRNRRLPETSGREGLIDLACAFAVLESAQAGRRVEIAEVLSDELNEYQQPINERYGIT
ncbi:MAG: hypothetical protein JXM70_12720, partial [Pirellulales bacterium]|nr:hypothetical protein [Pirellulales bacterium]